MRWVGWFLAGPVLWAFLFVAVYALHGVGCARGWPAVTTPVGSLHVTVMGAVWLAGLAGHAALLVAVPADLGRRGHLSRMGVWIGLVASLVTLSPILLASSCG